MEKFLSIPVTNEQNQFVRANDVVLVEQASATTTTITYSSQLVTTITHASVGAGNEFMRDFIQDSIVEVLRKPWTEPVLSVTPNYAVSGIAVAILPQPTS